MQFSLTHPAIAAKFDDIYPNNAEALGRHGYVFGRHDAGEFVLVAANFNEHEPLDVTIKLTEETITAWGLADGEYPLYERIESGKAITIHVAHGVGVVSLNLPPLASYAFTQ
ncbi:protein of unknown function [Vibrio tapetis subsp. tapetis]|uniref:Uncharacterized protein n=1 Tax=Vibrio tapetis subsp. tapetis TaxID=1671868 RepID=A0A2N8ZLZ4_9VIBR|nr:protein of unknown function [Vibrio tapetis subsp. tapetis]